MQTFRQVSAGLFARIILLIACGSALFVASSFATPYEDIARAVAVSGVSDYGTAHPKQFLKAFTAVVLRTQPRDLPDYVIAAVNMRRDLSPKIVAAAVKSAARRMESKQGALCAIIDRIIRAGIAANPAAAVSIAKAAVEAAPELRQCILAAAMSAAPDERISIQHATELPNVSLVFLTLTGVEDEGFSINPATLNPANFSDFGEHDAVNSPEQPPAH